MATGESEMQTTTEAARERAEYADPIRRTNGGERLRAAVRDDEWSATAVPISISVGTADWRSGQTGEDIVKAADAALYQVKRARSST
jgi:GGDEF domain-containing protein